MIQSMTASRGYLIDCVWALKHLQVFSSLFNSSEVFSNLQKSFQVFLSLLKSFLSVLKFWQCHFQSCLATSFPKLFGDVISKAFWQCHFQSFLAMSFPKPLTKVPDKQQEQEQEVSNSFLRPRYTKLLAVKKNLKLRFDEFSWSKKKNLDRFQKF